MYYANHQKNGFVAISGLADNRNWGLVLNSPATIFSSNRNQSDYLHCKSNDLVLYDKNIGHELVDVL